GAATRAAPAAAARFRKRRRDRAVRLCVCDMAAPGIGVAVGGTSVIVPRGATALEIFFAARAKMSMSRTPPFGFKRTERLTVVEKAKAFMAAVLQRLVGPLRHSPDL